MGDFFRRLSGPEKITGPFSLYTKLHMDPFLSRCTESRDFTKRISRHLKKLATWLWRTGGSKHRFLFLCSKWLLHHTMVLHVSLKKGDAGRPCAARTFSRFLCAFFIFYAQAYG